MNNNQDLNNNQAPNLNNIPVIPPTQTPQAGQPMVNNTQNITPPTNNTQTQNKFINVQPSAPSIQTENAINALNIGYDDNKIKSEPQNYNDTSINDLNIDGQYNRMEKMPDYVRDPEIQENIHPTKKDTVTITKEMKTVLIIVGVMLAFIIIMPFLFDLVSKIRFH